MEVSLPIEERLSLWRYVPVSLVLGYRLSVYGAILYVCPDFLIGPSLFDVVVWIVIITTVAFYLKTSLSNPGFQDWCPSQLLPNEEKKWSDSIKARLKTSPGQPRSLKKRRRITSQFVLSSSDEASDSSSSSSSSSSEKGKEEIVGYAGGAPVSVIPFKRDKEMVLDLGADSENVAGGICVTDSYESKQRKQVRSDDDDIMTTMESFPLSRGGGGGEVESISHLQIEITPDETHHQQAQETRKIWRHRVLAAFFILRQGCLWFREWTIILSTPYCGLFSRTHLNVSLDSIKRVPSLQPPVFSMGVHALYQGDEKLRFCHPCSTWQLLRTKHCRTCGRCVRLHDHHCPWLGVCVGEVNRVLFLVFLTWQTLELVLAATEIVLALFVRNTEWIQQPHHNQQEDLSEILPRIYLIITVFILICLAIFTAVLSVYHLFLVTTNLTTWETMSWNRISYLRMKSKAAGSPFGTPSCKTNLILATLPCAPAGSRLRQLASLNKWIDSRVVTIGPRGSLIWKPMTPGDTDYGRVPSCMRSSCCDLYEGCL
eukprot:Protomagalhaensia_sp_Gyna_25__1103@NODE_1539_length_1755_cov_40_509907_g1249_i0_p1_GENE_NODE_1539_length_1755_cov_40_509907_g1249_i0NODE_1539_length_1755_cov_40_509907_g1249_i0_p1_ORF_typecomplete_len542_score69_65DHHC/PF01529_20/1_2e04DHHC/PF01529_20/5_7e31SR25/PF10500_9/0_064DUF4692/PF15763_5/0_29DUF202/PF02656_15/0_87SK_channel/PF03530_14/1_5PhoR/PF11808_8/6_8e03PhoR/PF11808_8/2_6e03PhoR/PF11808_8/0_83DUF755/PF05501_11/3_5_NODE_1539_length_1755_cov_40_509907_g1249_i0461671